MRSKLFTGSLLILAVALTACSAPATPVATAMPPAMAATDAPTTASSSTGLTLSLSTKNGISTSFLVDSNGRSLYLFKTDTQNGGTSANNWPAFIVTAAPTAGTGVDASMIGTIKLSDGSLQATYNGWPLYYFHGDAAAGDTNGQGINNVWYLVSAVGDAITQ